jgi:CubicO group peptidase (beta-lactamase class C family)
MSHAQLPTSSPSDQGVDAGGILRFIDVLENSPTQDPHSLMILRHGHLIAQGWWAPYAPQRRHLLYSLSKSFTSAAAGIAISEGLLDLDEPAVSYFPEFDADITDTRSRTILVRHLASMSTGHTFDTLEQAQQNDPADIVRGFLMLPPERDPGTVFAYNQPATYTLASIIQKRSGLSLVDYLRPRLLDPLGIGQVGWQQYPAGRNIGFSGLFATTDAIARLGQLHLQRGSWHGEQLLPSDWVDQASSRQIDTPLPFPDDPASGLDWQQGYGFQFWMARHGYRGDGAYGQFCVILPEHDAVVAITSQTENMQETLDAIWRHLLPAFSEDASSNDADSTLLSRLDQLRLPLPANEESGANDSGSEFWRDASFAPAGGTCAAQPSLRSVHVVRESDGFTVTLADDSGDLSAPLTPAEWSVVDADAGAPPVAVAGGLANETLLQFDVAFIETPHRMRLSCDSSSGEFTARWVTEPLRLASTPLSDLKTPLPLG